MFLPQLIALIFVVGWTEVYNGVPPDGFRLYSYDRDGNGTQLGADIAPDARTLSLDEPNGYYTLAITAFAGPYESDPSPTLTLRVSRKGVRTLGQ